jgi:hypothetical protein
VELLYRGQLALGVGVELDPVAAQGMGQEDLGGQARGVDVIVFEGFDALLEGGGNVQGLKPAPVPA